MSETVEIPDAAVMAVARVLGGGEPTVIQMDAARAALVAARPYLMPTREEIGAALDPTAFVARKSDASYDQRRKLALQDADAVLALLNGAES